MPGEPDDDDIRAQLEAVQAEIDGLDLENQIFEAVLQKNAALVSQLKADKPHGGAKGSKGKDAHAGQLTPAQKSEIGAAHLEMKKKGMEDSRKASEKLVDTLRAVRYNLLRLHTIHCLACWGVEVQRQSVAAAL